MTNLLKARNICISIDNKQILSDVSIDIDKGEIVGLLGPNGAGKTTTFYSIAGITHIDSGSIIYNDEEICDLPMYVRCQKGLAYLPQESSIFEDLTVLQNLYGTIQLIDQPDDDNEVNNIIEKFQLTNILDKTGRMLSGGERRKTEIARMLLTEPNLVLLDEPFSGVDPIVVEEIKQILLNLKNDGISILITDHNVRDTLNICDRSNILFDGSVFMSGNKNEITANEVIKKRYLGKSFD